MWEKSFSLLKSVNNVFYNQTGTSGHGLMLHHHYAMKLLEYFMAEDNLALLFGPDLCGSLYVPPRVCVDSPPQSKDKHVRFTADFKLPIVVDVSVWLFGDLSRVHSASHPMSDGTGSSLPATPCQGQVRGQGQQHNKLSVQMQNSHRFLIHLTWHFTYITTSLWSSLPLYDTKSPPTSYLWESTTQCF